MWNETDLDDQFVPEHLVNHLNTRQKENGEMRHLARSEDNLMESQQSHLLGLPSHDMLTDAMLGHIGSGEREQVRREEYRQQVELYTSSTSRPGSTFKP